MWGWYEAVWPHPHFWMVFWVVDYLRQLGGMCMLVIGQGQLHITGPLIVYTICSTELTMNKLPHINSKSKYTYQCNTKPFKNSLQSMICIHCVKLQLQHNCLSLIKAPSFYYKIKYNL